MFEYGLYFLITLGASILFAIIGVGSSLVLIPVFTLMGVDFAFAKAIGLFANGVTTISTSVNNIKNGLFDFKKIFPFLIISVIFAILGAFSSRYIDESIVKVLLVLFIFLSLTFTYIGHSLKQETKQCKNYKTKIYIFISIVAFIGGLIGVGGGIVYLPFFIYIGLKVKESIVMTSALIPFVSFSAFFTYITFVEIDWILLILVAIGAIAGGQFGSIIMGKIENEKYLRIFILALLFFVALDMLYMNFFGV